MSKINIELGDGFDFSKLISILRRYTIKSNDDAIIATREHTIGKMTYTVNSFFPKDTDTTIRDNIDLLVRKNLEDYENGLDIETD